MTWRLEYSIVFLRFHFHKLPDKLYCIYSPNTENHGGTAVAHSQFHETVVTSAQQMIQNK